ncbi:formate/nitrite transporter family protein [Tractidigestivibacter scatoligenes]|jgi:formate transporter|uniref:formate/nitrite transporter family protein n=1 Tax=Tractidigestivibacter scatoligenes TaxID=1299998 RepID=UPI002F359F5B
MAEQKSAGSSAGKGQDCLSPAQTLRKAADVGAGKASMSRGRAFVLAMMAGLFIAMGAALMLVVKSDSSLGFAFSQILSGLVFSVGLFLVVVAGAELFTGNNLMAIGCLSGRYGAGRLVGSWLTVYAGNFVGSLLLVLILAGANFAGLNGGAVGVAAASVAASKASLSPMVAFCRGIMCNVLVCLAVWMSFAGHTVVDKFLACVMPVMGFVASGYEHCVANMFFLPYGLLTQALGLGGGAPAVSLAGTCSNLLCVTLGNLVGGAILVGCGYWLAYRRDFVVDAHANG